MDLQTEQARFDRSATFSPTSSARSITGINLRRLVKNSIVNGSATKQIVTAAAAFVVLSSAAHAG